MKLLYTVLTFGSKTDAPQLDHKELVGSLFFDFGDPTVMAHDKTVYWAFDAKGRISEQQYRDAKQKNQPLQTLATVKVNSSHKIMGDDGDVTNRSIYYAGKYLSATLALHLDLFQH